VNATGQGSQQTDMRPTIVLVHGAFADASSWNVVLKAARAVADSHR
jgi:pimeloyl-ACP methyl ester carboxylesterase